MAASPESLAPTEPADVAVDFLRRLYPSGPWLLTAIIPDGPIETVRFGPETADACRAWIADRDGRANLYYSPNEPLPGVTKKAAKVDIARVHVLHADLDARPGETTADAIARTRRLLMEALPAEVPPPTAVVSSGGGHQALWRLREPVPIEGDRTRAEDVERYNIALGALLDADHAHDISRVLRLPGTLNLPNRRKRAKGREPVRSALVAFHAERVYDLAAFPVTPAPCSVPASASPTRLAEPAAIAPRRLGSVEELPAAVSELCRAVIVHGHDPNDAHRWPSRSEALFFVCCELVRAGADEATLLGIITDPDFGISASVLDKAAKAEDYARRQIQKARERVASELPPASGGAVPEGPPILSKHTPYQSAAAFLSRERPHLKHFNDDWLTYDGAAYVELEDATVRAEVYAFLERARVRIQGADGSWTLAPFNPNTSKVSQVIDALEARAHVPRDLYEPPCWLEGEGPSPREIVACRNGLLHLPTGELLPATPRFFTRNALAFAHDPSATETPEWLAFLRSLWGDEADSIASLQEVFGYLLTPDTSLQKAFLLLGPPRSGKGTIGRVLTELVGRQNTCAPTLLSLAESFGLQPLIGRQLAIVSDLRLGPKTDRAAIAENLLRITGEDLITANRKYKREWTGRLATRFLIMTNEVPRFADASGALANRFVPLVMTETFLGREDAGLVDRLLAELPGIFNWAITGWRRLRARGHFALPAASQELVQQLADAASPVAAFVRDECVVEPDGEVEKDALFQAWRFWCERNGRHPGTSDTLGRELMAALGGKVRATRRRTAGRRVPIYAGLRLLGEAVPF